MQKLLFLPFRSLVGKPVREFNVNLRMGHGIDYHYYSRDDERHTEPLPHVERHRCLESHLIVLDEFYKETRKENAYEEYAEYESRTLLCVLFQYSHISSAKSAK